MIRLRDLVAKIKLVFDKTSGSEAEGEARNTLDRIGGAAKALGATLVAVFAVDKIKDWTVAVVKEAAAAEAVWNRLGGTLGRLGISVDAVKHEIDAAARAMQDATTIGDEEFAATLNELMNISQDYEGSLRNVAVAADFAAAKQIDLDTAAKLVGKAMIGETDTLKRYGVVVTEGGDAVEELRRQFAGAAQNEAQTFNGKMTQLSNAFGDFKEELGGLLLSLGDSTGIIDVMIGVLRRATQAMEDVLRVSILIRSGIAMATRNPAAIARAANDLAEMEARKAERLRSALLDDEYKSRGLVRGESMAARQARIDRERERNRPEREKEKPQKERDPADDIWNRVVKIKNPGAVVAAVTEELDKVTPAATMAASAFEQMFSVIALEGETAKDLLANMGVALVTGGTAGLSHFAKSRAKMAAAQAIHAFADGVAAAANPAKAAVTGENAAGHFTAAAKYTAAAGMWAALGKIGAPGGQSGGGGGYTPFGRDNGAGALAARSEIKSETHIWLDPFDPSRPAIIRSVYAANQTGRELFGDDAKINVHTYAPVRP